MAHDELLHITGDGSPERFQELYAQAQELGPEQLIAQTPEGTMLRAQQLSRLAHAGVDLTPVEILDAAATEFDRLRELGVTVPEFTHYLHGNPTDPGLITEVEFVEGVPLEHSARGLRDTVRPQLHATVQALAAYVAEAAIDPEEGEPTVWARDVAAPRQYMIGHIAGRPEVILDVIMPDVDPELALRGEDASVELAKARAEILGPWQYYISE